MTERQKQLTIILDKIKKRSPITEIFLRNELNLRRKALHASAPKGFECTICFVDEEPCPACYEVDWKLRHTNMGRTK